MRAVHTALRWSAMTAAGLAAALRDERE